jgi:hypothetical protein
MSVSTLPPRFPAWFHGFPEIHAPFLKRKAHTLPGPVLRTGNSGIAHRDHCDVLLPGLSLSRRLKGDLAGAFINQTGVREIQAMFLQICLPFGLVPNDHELIVATSGISWKLIVVWAAAFL